jgi:hypothetical protein
MKGRMCFGMAGDLQRLVGFCALHNSTWGSHTGGARLLVCVYVRRKDGRTGWTVEVMNESSFLLSKQSN